MIFLSKEEIFKKFGKDFACEVTYRNQKKTVKYASCKHVNWKNADKITVETPPKVLLSPNNELVTRKGIAIKLK